MLNFFKIVHTVIIIIILSACIPNNKHEIIKETSLISNTKTDEYKLLLDKLERNTEDYKTRIAVLDSGYNFQDSYLKNFIKESYNYTNEDGRTDNYGHGTITLSILKDLTNRLNLDVEVISIKVLDENGFGKIDKIIMGVSKAIELKVDVILLPLGIYKDYEELREIIKKADKYGILVIAPSGNDGLNTVQYPAAYPYVLSVGDDKNDYSNYGTELDIVAPGYYEFEKFNENIKDSKELLKGTSISSTFVAGLSIVIKNINPNFKSAEIKNSLKIAADNSSDIWNDNKGYGFLNVKSLIEKIELLSYDIYEPNNHKEDSKPLQTNKKLYIPLEKNDIDYFRFSTKFSGTLKIEEIDETLINNIEIIVLSGEKEQTLYSDSINIDAGDYYVAIKNKSNKKLLIEPIFYFTLTDNSRNTNFSTAKELNFGDTIEDIIINKEEKYYTFTVSKESTINFKVESGDASFDPSILIYQDELSDPFKIDEYPSGKEENFSIKLKKGKYYIKVRNMNETNLDESYQVTVDTK